MGEMVRACFFAFTAEADDSPSMMMDRVFGDQASFYPGCFVFISGTEAACSCSERGGGRRLRLVGVVVGAGRRVRDVCGYILYPFFYSYFRCT